jgi:6-phosphogluconolactonase
MRTSRSLLTLAFAVLVLNGCGGSSFYSIGGTVSGLVGSRLTLQNNGSIVTIEPAANGFQLLFNYLPNGAPYDITVATQPTIPSQTCVVTNGNGTIASADVTDIKVTCTTTPARFLLGEGAGACISTSAIDSTSGALTATSGSPSCFGLGLYDNQGFLLVGLPEGPMVVDPQGRFLYMAVYEGQIGLLPVFAIDRNSGALTFVHWVPGPMGLDFIAFDPSGRFLFATGTHGAVETLTVDSASGALTDSEYLSFQDSTSSPSAVSVDPLGRFVYVTYEEFSDTPPYQNMVIALSLDSKSGALSQIASPVAIGATYAGGPPVGTVWLAPHPSGKYLYAGPVASNHIAAYSIDPADGTLNPISGSPFPVGNGPSAAAVDPYGKYLYVTNSGSNDISAYAIDSDSGVLTPINGSPFPTGSAPSSIAVEPLGHFVYVSNALGVSAYQIDPLSGALSPISGSPFTFAYGAVISY